MSASYAHYAWISSLWRLGCATMLSLTLLGCAAQQSFREGESLLAAGKLKEGLSKLQQAATLEPGNAQFRIRYLTIRDANVQRLSDQADQTLHAKRYEEALALYRQVLALDGNNDRALDGLRLVDQATRHDAWINDAQSAWSKKDAETALAKLRLILLENPKQERARALQKAINEANAKPAVDTQLSGAYRKPITIEFKDVGLKTVFEMIARSSGLNFVFDKDVRTDQKTSIYLKNSTIENALNIVLLTNQLEQRVLDANSVLIYPATAAKQKDYTPLTVKSFFLANADAKTVANTLRTIVKSRDVVVDEKLNMIIMRDSPEAVRMAEKLVALHDLAEPEVMLEVEILEVKRTRLTELGIRWPDRLELNPLPINKDAALTLRDLGSLNRDRIGASLGTAAVNSRKLDSDTNILANPRIRTRNREKAKILIGERVPNITATSTSSGFVAESVNYVDVGLKLDVEPTIYLDGEVAIKVSLEVSNIINQLTTKSGSVAYQIGTRTATTVLRLKDGETQVLAGLINDEDRRTANKVPGIGEVPVVGRLFGSQLDDGSKTEIVLSITPRLVRNIQRPEGEFAEFDGGTDSSLRARADGGVSGGAAAATTPLAAPLTTGVLPNSTATATNPTASGLNTPAPVNGNTSAPVPAPSGGGTAVPAPRAAAGTAQLRWQGPAQLKVGDTFAVQLLMQSDVPVVSIPLAVDFNPQILQVTSVTEGDFLKQNGAQTSFTSRIDPAGQVLITGTRAGDTGASAPGAVATLNFKVVAASTDAARVQLLTIAPVALGGKAVAAPLPSPHTLTITP